MQKRPRRGQPLRLDAQEMDRVFRAVDRFERMFPAGERATSLKGAESPNVVTVINKSGGTLTAGTPVRLTEVDNFGNATRAMLFRRKVFQADEIDADWETDFNYAILMETLVDDGVGLAAVGGVCQAKIILASTLHQYATFAPGSLAFSSTPDPSAPFKILDTDPDTLAAGKGVMLRFQAPSQAPNLWVRTGGSGIPLPGVGEDFGDTVATVLDLDFTAQTWSLSAESVTVYSPWSYPPSWDIRVDRVNGAWFATEPIPAMPATATGTISNGGSGSATLDHNSLAITAYWDRGHALSSDDIASGQEIRVQWEHHEARWRVVQAEIEPDK